MNDQFPSFPGDFCSSRDHLQSKVQKLPFFFKEMGTGYVLKTLIETRKKPPQSGMTKVCLIENTVNAHLRKARGTLINSIGRHGIQHQRCSYSSEKVKYILSAWKIKAAFAIWFLFFMIIEENHDDLRCNFFSSNKFFNLVVNVWT